MNHVADEDLLLEYYGERSAPSADHLAACGNCAARYAELKAFLDSVSALDPPERGERYGLEVWQQIRHRLPPRESQWLRLFDLRLAVSAAAVLVLLVTGFAAGRLWPPAEQHAQPTPVSSTQASDDEESRRRVVLLTVTDHLDRSHRVLADVMNASGPRALSAEQQWAGDLVAASRLYRQNAIALDEPAVASVLEELERVLLDIVHQPPAATAADFEDIRRRIDSAALMFKVRVMTNELQRRLEEPSSATRSPSPSTIG